MSPSRPFALTPELAERASALARLLADTRRAADDDGKPALPDGELVTHLRGPLPAGSSITDWALARLGGTHGLSPVQHGMLDFADGLLGMLWAPPVFHPQLADSLRPLQGAIAAAALSVDGWITNPGHPVRGLLAVLHTQACGWQPELGPTAENTRQRLLDCFRPAVDGSGDWHAVAAATQKWQSDEQHRLERLEQRLTSAEAGQLRTRRARLLAARLINQNMADLELPPDVCACLHEDWFPALQWALLHEGEHGALWQRVKRLTGTWRWTLHAGSATNDESRNKLMRVVTQASEDLEALAPRLFSDEAVRQRVLATIEAAHLAALRGMELPRTPFVPVDAQDALAQGHAEVSATLLDAVRALAPGQWFLHRDSQGERRIKLVLRQDDTQQLLFTNALGAKALTASFDAFALCLSGGGTTALPMRPDVDAQVELARDALSRRQQQAQQQRMAALKAAREQAAAEARAKEEARQKALAEAQALEAARQETLRKAAEAQHAVEAAAQDAARQRLQRARLQASSLTIGSWLDFHQADGSTLRRRVTVILPSSGKFILVDVDGTGRLELGRDEMAQGLADGRITTLEQDRRLDDTLSRVVDGLRQGKGEGST